MISGKTESGFEFELDVEVLNDAELIENIKAIDKGDITVLPDIAESVLGQEQKKKLYEHIRSSAGRVKMDILAIEIGEIFKSSKQIKN